MTLRLSRTWNLSNLKGFKLKSQYQYRWLMFAVLGMLYFLVCLHRISPTVIARDLVLEFDAGATALGLMASAYFYLYAIAQPPVGVLSDLWGPRRLIVYFRQTCVSRFFLHGKLEAVYSRLQVNGT